MSVVQDKLPLRAPEVSFHLDEILNVRNRQLRSVAGTALIVLKAVPEEL